jgi:hypothetical protein
MVQELELAISLTAKTNTSNNFSLLCPNTSSLIRIVYTSPNPGRIHEDAARAKTSFPRTLIAVCRECHSYSHGPVHMPFQCSSKCLATQVSQ